MLEVREKMRGRDSGRVREKVLRENSKRRKRREGFIDLALTSLRSLQLPDMGVQNLVVQEKWLVDRH